MNHGLEVFNGSIEKGCGARRKFQGFIIRGILQFASFGIDVRLLTDACHRGIKGVLTLEMGLKHRFLRSDYPDGNPLLGGGGSLGGLVDFGLCVVSINSCNGDNSAEQGAIDGVAPGRRHRPHGFVGAHLG
jgi:hypothetical protein